MNSQTDNGLLERYARAIQGVFPGDWHDSDDGAKCDPCMRRSYAVLSIRDEEMERLRSELTKRSESRDFWRKFAMKLEAERDEARAERDALKEENGKLRRQLLDQQNHARTLMNEANDVRAQLEAESDLFYLLRTERDALKAALREAHGREAKYAQKAIENGQRAERAEAELATVKRNWKYLSEALASARKEIVGRKEYGEKLRAERDALKARLAEYENAETWLTSCLACPKVLASSIAEHERAEKAEATLAAVLSLRDDWARGRAPGFARELTETLEQGPATPSGTEEKETT